LNSNELDKIKSRTTLAKTWLLPWSCPCTQQRPVSGWGVGWGLVTASISDPKKLQPNPEKKEKVFDV